MKTIPVIPENDIRYSDRRHPVDILEPVPTPDDQLDLICEVLSRTFGWVVQKYIGDAVRDALKCSNPSSGAIVVSPTDERLMVFCARDAI